MVQVKNLATTLAKKRTSLDLPPDLLERTDEAVRLGVARSRNSLIAVALEDYLDTLDRVASIDACFAEMRHDAHYVELQRALADGFAASDDATFAASFGDDPAKLGIDDALESLVLETAGP